MSTYVILIDRNTPEHWDHAKENGFWDLQKAWRGLGADDTVYFWVTGTPGRVVGRARAAGDKRPLAPDAPHAWSAGDSRRGEYRYRIDLQDFQDLDVQISWGEVADHADAGGRLNPVTEIPEQGVSWLERRLGLMVADPYDVAIDALAHDADSYVDIEALGEDRRQRVPATVVIRRGQRAFREELLRVYRRQCVVTGTTLVALLEAAHISPYGGEQTDLAENGLLLRADIHTLFDLHLLTIDARDDTVRLTPELQDDETYRSLQGHRIDFPDRLRPDPTLLAKHNADCEWL
ncbi:HNH endonuclease [Terracoccus luteus]|uniref:HNH endonuclease n=1 Tax=Terracoccus luteus TaxID=53356 RepID=A0A495XY89_9MICO|nr:HNH endonuclease [Terracoccus luteus]RKT76708.1 HNH endonuclease [Terracoccus luteus]